MNTCCWMSVAATFVAVANGVMADNASPLDSTTNEWKRTTWLVFFGGQAESPCWTVVSPSRVSEQVMTITHPVTIAELFPVALGCDAIVFPAGIRKSRNLPKTLGVISTPITDVTALAETVLDNLSVRSTKSPSTILVLQPTLASCFDKERMMKYIEEPIVLAVENRSITDVVCAVTEDLRRIIATAEELPLNSRPRLATAAAEDNIERVWIDDILRPTGLRVHDVKMNLKIGCLVISLEGDIELKGWADIYSGKVLCHSPIKRVKPSGSVKQVKP